MNTVDWPCIDTVFFDMDGTLLDLEYDNYIWLNAMPTMYAKLNKIPFLDAVKHIKNHIKIVSGTLDAYCFNYWSCYLGFDLLRLHKELKHKIAYRKNAESLLLFLKNKGYKVLLATNAHPDNVKLKFSALGLNKYLNEVHISHVYGAPKESNDFWHGVSKKAPFNQKSSLFIDDNLTVLRTAKKFGIDNLLAVSTPCSVSDAVSTHEFASIDDLGALIPKLNKSN